MWHRMAYTGIKNYFLAAGRKVRIPPLPMAKRSLLCLDRYQGLLEALRLVLEEFGYEVFTSEFLRPGLALLHSHRPDAVLLHPRLCPACPDDCFVEQVRNIDPNVKVLVWEAYDRGDVTPPPCPEVTLIKLTAPERLKAQLDLALEE